MRSGLILLFPFRCIFCNCSCYIIIDLYCYNARFYEGLGGFMKRLVLFSHVPESVLQNVLPLIFPESLQPKIFACMPCDGSQIKGRRYELFVSSWSAIAQQYQAEFVFIDNRGE